MNFYGIFDEAGNWVATDKDGKPLPTPEAREDRIAKALESIAESIEKIANPQRQLRSTAFDTDPPCPRCGLIHHGPCPSSAAKVDASGTFDWDNGAGVWRTAGLRESGPA